MSSPFLLQVVNNTDAREFFEGIPYSEHDLETAGKNKLVLLSVLSLLKGRSQAPIPLRDLSTKAGLSLSPCKKGLYSLRSLDFISLIHRQGLPHLVAIGGRTESLTGLISDE